MTRTMKSLIQNSVHANTVCTLCTAHYIPRYYNNSLVYEGQRNTLFICIYNGSSGGKVSKSFGVWGASSSDSILERFMHAKNSLQYKACTRYRRHLSLSKQQINPESFPEYHPLSTICGSCNVY